MTCKNAVFDDKSNAKIRIPFPKKAIDFHKLYVLKRIMKNQKIE